MYKLSGVILLTTMLLNLTPTFASLVTERVNCAGALSTEAVATKSHSLYSVGEREIRVLITPTSAYNPPTDDFIELPMSDDRIPTMSNRFGKLLRQVKKVAFGWSRSSRREVVQFDMPPSGNIDSTLVRKVAADLTVRGYTEESLGQRDFDVRIGAVQFSGREFWTSLGRIATTQNFVSVRAERGFGRPQGGLPTVAITEGLTWAARGVFLGTLAGLGLHVADVLPFPHAGVLASMYVVTAVALSAQVSAFASEIEKVSWLRPIRRLVTLIPDYRGLVSTVRLPAVREHRAEVVAKNVVEALKDYPDINTVQIVTASTDDVKLVERVVERHILKFKDAEDQKLWVESDPKFERFPRDLRYKTPNLNHRPTKELVSSLKRTFAAKRFTSPEEFIRYYDPKNLPEWADGKHDWSFQQIVAIYLFDSLRWSLPQFFALQPSFDQVRQVMEIPADHFDRGQMHEFPSGNSVLGTMALVAWQAENVFGDDVFGRESSLRPRTLPAFEFEAMVRAFGVPGRALHYAKVFSVGLRPIPESFAWLPENHPQISAGKPDLKQFPVPEDNW